MHSQNLTRYVESALEHSEIIKTYLKMIKIWKNYNLFLGLLDQFKHLGFHNKEFHFHLYLFANIFKRIIFKKNYSIRSGICAVKISSFCK